MKPIKIYDVLNKNFDNLKKELSVDTIDYFNKIDNLCSSGEIDDTTYYYINNMKHGKEVLQFIKDNIDNYRNDIIYETIRIKEEWNCTNDYELDAGLYNMDELYLKAIEKIIL